ncbi:MAG TPA: CDP-alcohol phosphatidyltransferase family protein [Candidatus Thermoplasmatota archaeon]|nr:CDP-alcohol phosphatidyltransferase family protein [Candidatus Thermoplasmatota archaeon]
MRAYLHAALRDEWDGLDRINRDLRLADMFTLINALMGLGALVAASRLAGLDTAANGIHLAIELVLVGVIMDGVDGAVARLGKGNGPLGGVLDTLADAVTFVTTSAVVAFLSIYTSTELGNHWYGIGLIVLPMAFYMVCGLLRLARFEALRDDGKTRQYFSGIPSPAAAVTLLSLVLVKAPAWILLIAAVYIGVLMVSRIRFPKVRGWGAVASVVILLSVLVTFPNAELQRIVAWFMLGFMVLYVLIGPFLVLARHGPGPDLPGMRS